MPTEEVSAAAYILIAQPRGQPSRPCLTHVLVSGALLSAVCLITLMLAGTLPARSSMLELAVPSTNESAPQPQVLACAFVHGAGNSAESDPSTIGSITEENVYYWGQVHQVLRPFCFSFHFMHEDTLHAGWDEPRLQRRLCSLLHAAASATSFSEGRGGRVAIFAHSLGNLLVAGALHSGQCALPPAAAWFAVAAPWAGSKAADKLPELCAGVMGGFASQMIQSLASRQHFCDGPDGGPSAGYASLKTTNAQLLEAARQWQWRVNASLCGDSAFGLWASEGGGVDSYELRALAEFVQYGEANDGAVPTGPCHSAAGSLAAGRTPLSVHYSASVNHYDLTCRHGDGWLPWLLPRDARRPCAWYAAMAERMVSAGQPPSHADGHSLPEGATARAAPSSSRATWSTVAPRQEITN